MAKQNRFSRKSTRSDCGESVAAHVTLDLGRIKGSYVFEEISVLTDDPKNLCIIFAKSDGQSIKVQLARVELRKHISWRLFLDL